MADLLLELYSEEIPARFQKSGAAQLGAACARALKAQAITVESTQLYHAPQRVALWMRGVAPSAAQAATIRGPRCDAPQAALDGFLRKHGARMSELAEDKGHYVLARRRGGEALEAQLGRALRTALAQHVWPKSMRWSSDELRWVRPLRNIVCLLDDAVLPLALGGLRANRTLRGHRFLSPAPVELAHARDYAAQLKRRHVLADAAERRALIERQSAGLLPRGLRLVSNAPLLDELTGLVEYPCTLFGSMDKAFLKLPPPVLKAVLERQQKYLCVEDGRGRLAPHFLVVANHLGRDRGRTILAGHEQVLGARLKDAAFFWQQDTARGLDAMAGGLDGLVFEARLGTMRARSQRLARLAAWLVRRIQAPLAPALVRRAAALCKADLLSVMVQEFPDLQGEMGAAYARAAGEPAELAQAIREHYLPRHAADALPASLLGRALALAERCDLLAGFWLLGEQPSASKDPYGLRRAALGLVRLAEETPELGDMGAMVAQALAGYRGQAAAKSAAPALKADILRFVRERLAHYLGDKHRLRADVFAALSQYEARQMKGQMTRGEAELDIARTMARAQHLQAFLNTGAGADLFTAFHRAAGILHKGTSPAARAYQRADLAAAPPRLPTWRSGTPQAALAQALRALNARLARKARYQEQLAALANLRAPMDQLFADVLIEDKNAAVRAAHHALLLRALVAIAAAAGDLGRIDRTAFGASVP